MAFSVSPAQPGALLEMLHQHLSGWSLASILDWLMSNTAQLANPNELTLRLGEQLKHLEVPIVRLRLSVRFEPPREGQGWAAIWQFGQPFQSDITPSAGFTAQPAYRGSPLEEIDSSGVAFRQKLDSDAADLHPVLTELAAQGATDYFAVPVTSQLGFASMVVVSDRIGGLSDSDIQKLEALSGFLGTYLDTAMHTYLNSRVHE